jgi:hypothetical protein
VKLLELAQRAVILYEKQTVGEKRRIINFVCSNSLWKDGRLQPNYRQPFDILVKNNVAHQKEKTLFPKEKGFFENWLPSADSNPDTIEVNPDPDGTQPTELSIKHLIAFALFQDLICFSRSIASDRVLNVSEYAKFHGPLKRLVVFEPL